MSTSESVDLRSVIRCVNEYSSIKNRGGGAARAHHSESSGGQVWLQSTADKGETESPVCLRGTDPRVCC